MTPRFALAVLAVTAFLPVATRADSPAPAAVPTSPTAVDSALQNLATPDHAPFGFTYGGKDAAALLPGWTKSEADAKTSAGIPVRQVIYRDPATKLKVVVEIRKLADFSAVDWVLNFTNEGTVDTPILENIQPLHATVPSDAKDAVLHSAAGSGQSIGDFNLTDTPIQPGQPFSFGMTTGRSSDALRSINGNIASFPFFNIETGDHGTFGAIGWTGNWLMQINRAADGKSIALEAGMPKTHLLLHPGETIRTPRILLMNWHGDITDAQNAWRRLMLADYSPKDIHGQMMMNPACFGSWGAESIDVKIAAVNFIHDKKIPADLYWIDAGWFGKKDLDWVHNRGSWTPIPEWYPNGFKPLGDLCKADNLGLLIWLEAETAMPGTTFPTQHPDWYITKPPGTGADDEWPDCLNLANPAALKGMTDFVSQLITDSGMTWYRQDFNFCPARYWDSQDKPDRIGMTEIGAVTGLYAFWDGLLARHPGLRIDNCASGGRRIDIETMSRSVALHRSDAAGIPLGEQFHAQGLIPWDPLNDGIPGAAVTDGSSALQIYNSRSGYSPGINFSVDPKFFNNDAAVDAARKNITEFREVRPYFYGDFYPLLPQTLDSATWCAWQLDRPDLNSGAILCLRRTQSIYCTLQLDLHKIDPAATYEVEVRTTLEHAPVKTISGADFAHFQVTVPDLPGSAVVFYHKK
jgi:alpha-galactosidase